MQQPQFVGDSIAIDVSDNLVKRQTIKKIHEKYKGSEFNYEDTKTEEALSAWQRFKKWLSEIFQELFSFNTPEGSKNAVEAFLKIFGILLILFVLFKIISAFMNKDGNWVFGRQSDNISIHASDIEKDIYKTDFLALIEEALLKTDFRLAIRYYYLQTLKQLAEKGIIAWDSEKTNYDYNQEIKEEKVKKQFQYTSYIYDYCWYGEFPIEKQEFDTSEKAFNKLFNMINEYKIRN